MVEDINVTIDKKHLRKIKKLYKAQIEGLEGSIIVIEQIIKEKQCFLDELELPLPSDEVTE